MQNESEAELIEFAKNMRWGWSNVVSEPSDKFIHVEKFGCTTKNQILYILVNQRVEISKYFT